MQETLIGWNLDVERGPDCLFVRLKSPGRIGFAEIALADQLWELLNRHFTYRLVLDLGRIDLREGGLLEELISLMKKVCARDGMLRLCGLSSYNKEVLDRCHLESNLPTYSDRREAMFAGRPTQPR